MGNDISTFEKRYKGLIEKDYLNFTDNSRQLVKEIKDDYKKLQALRDVDDLNLFFKSKEKIICKKINDFYQLNYKYFLNRKRGLASVAEEAKLTDLYINKVINIKDITIIDELSYNEIILTDDDYESIKKKDSLISKKGKINKELMGGNAHDGYLRDYSIVLDLIVNDSVENKDFIQFGLGFEDSVIDIKNIIRNDIKRNIDAVSQDIMDVKKRYSKYKKFIVGNKDLINQYRIDSSSFYKLERMLESLDFEDEKLVVSIGVNSIIIESNLRGLLSSLSSSIKTKNIELNKISEMKDRITHLYLLTRIIYLQSRLLASIYKLILKTQKVNLTLLIKIEFLKSSLAIEN